MLEVCDNILFNSLCALGDGAVSPIDSSLKYYRDEYVAHVEAGGCPSRERPRIAAVTPRSGGVEGAIPLGEVLP
jgi:NADH-quinone oxidoreductase subunit F